MAVVNVLVKNIIFLTLFLLSNGFRFFNCCIYNFLSGQIYQYTKCQSKGYARYDCSHARGC